MSDWAGPHVTLFYTMNKVLQYIMQKGREDVTKRDIDIIMENMVVNMLKPGSEEETKSGKPNEVAIMEGHVCRFILCERVR